MRTLKAIVLLIIVITIFILALNNFSIFNNKQSGASQGDPPIEEEVFVHLDGQSKAIKTDNTSINKLNTSYVKYINNLLSFDQLIHEEVEYLRNIGNLPVTSQESYLTNVGYSADSISKIYYQSNTEKSRTVLLKVSYSSDGNTVKKIYDGEYYEFVSVNKQGNQLTFYKNEKETKYEVK